MINIDFVESPRERSAICEKILNALPDWFGNPESLANYVSDCADMPLLACFESSAPTGFLALNRHNDYTMEIHVMGILPEYHRKGIGRALAARAEAFARENGARLFEVKTLASAHPDPYYARTREFYRALGFMPLEVISEIWGADNPCLIMVKPL